MKKILLFIGIIFLSFGVVSSQDDDDEIIVSSDMLGRKLTRRTTSSLTEGIPVDVNPYLLHTQSIVNNSYYNNYVYTQTGQRPQISSGNTTSGVLSNVSGIARVASDWAAVALELISLLDNLRDYRYYEFDVEVKNEPSHFKQYNPKNSLPQEITDNMRPQAIISVGAKEIFQKTIKWYLKK